MTALYEPPPEQAMGVRSLPAVLTFSLAIRFPRLRCICTRPAMVPHL
jgi:hypothetical protein